MEIVTQVGIKMYKQRGPENVRCTKKHIELKFVGL